MSFEGQNLGLISQKELNITNVNSEVVVNSEARGALARLDNLSDFSDECKMEMVGVFCGVKPAALLWKDFSGNRSNLNLDLKKIRLITADLGLEMDVANFEKNKSNLVSCNILVSKDRKKINQLFELRSEFPLDHSLFGRLLGYPESAIKEFPNGKRFKGDMRQLCRDNTAACFIDFALSEENYEEEINNYGRKIETVMREFLPKTYEHFVKNQQGYYLASDLIMDNGPFKKFVKFLEERKGSKFKNYY